MAVVLMDELPRSAGGKLLRIDFATRCGLPEITDRLPLSARHFKALNSTAPGASPI